MRINRVHICIVWNDSEAPKNVWAFYVMCYGPDASCRVYSINLGFVLSVLTFSVPFVKLRTSTWWKISDTTIANKENSSPFSRLCQKKMDPTYHHQWNQRSELTQDSHISLLPRKITSSYEKQTILVRSLPISVTRQIFHPRDHYPYYFLIHRNYEGNYQEARDYHT